MKALSSLKARFPRLFPAMTLLVAVGAVGGIAAYERRASAEGSCCYAGSPCCYPGSPCCAGHKQASR